MLYEVITGGESVLYDYKVDSVALFDITAITYQWFDYILKNGAKPAILKNKINYERNNFV